MDHRKQSFVMFFLMGVIFLSGTSMAKEEAFVSCGQYDVRSFGAIADGKTLATHSIQAAIDACAEAGGGTVVLAGGTYLSGTIVLKSYVNLQVASGAILLGTKDLTQYPVKRSKLRTYTENYADKSLIYAEKQKNISITGHGTIDGQGKDFGGPYKDKVRPYMIRIIECKDVTVRDITLLDSPMWVQHYMACNGVIIENLTVRCSVNANNDGIDIDSCENVRISNCNIYAADDAIVLKNTLDRLCRYVTITNCVLKSHCNAFKIGTESGAGFQDITVNNCVIYDTTRSAIALELVDGGVFERVIISNITIRNVANAIFIRLGNRARPFLSEGPGGGSGGFTPKEGAEAPGMGSMRDIIISNILATDVGPVGCAIAGLPGHPIENVTLNNIRINFRGGGKKEDVFREIPEVETKYPAYGMFGTLPAYGFYTRHVKNISFEHIDLTYDKPEKRPAMVFDNVEQMQMFDVSAQADSDTPMVVWLNDVKDGLIHGNRPGKIEGPYLQVNGKNIKGITLMNNEFSGVKEVVRKGEEVGDDAVSLRNNGGS